MSSSPTVSRRLRLVSATALVGLVGSGSAAAAHINVLTVPRTAGDRGLVLGVADTPTEAARGLRGVPRRRGHGLLFVHGIGPAPAFTMAGMRYALVALHVSTAGVVLARVTMFPCRHASYRDCRVYPSPVGTRMTVEALPADVRSVRVGRRLLPESVWEVVSR